MQCLCTKTCQGFGVYGFNATFNNISAKSWQEKKLVRPQRLPLYCLKQNTILFEH